MFTNRRLRKEQELFRKIEMIQPTSKSELKKTCLVLSNLDVDKAERMYKFLVDDMNGLPDVPPAQKSFIQNFGEQANGFIGWLEEHGDFFEKAYDRISGIVASRKSGGAVVKTTEALPKINP